MIVPRLALLAALLPHAAALTISTAHVGRTSSAAAEYSWASALVNRDVTADDAHTPPPQPRMGLQDMQMLDMELYDMEERCEQEWSERLLDAQGGAFVDDDDICDLDTESLSSSAFIR